VGHARQEHQLPRLFEKYSFASFAFANRRGGAAFVCSSFYSAVFIWANILLLLMVTIMSNWSFVATATCARIALYLVSEMSVTSPPVMRALND
jgi:hypothetical protein